MMAFIWIALVYVIVAFTDMTAAAFVSGTEELEAAGRTFNPGGAVAAASVMYLAVALAMGLVERWLAPPLWMASLVFVPLAFGAAWAGTWMSHVLVLDHASWTLWIVAYCVVASLMPVRYLLQPRGYLGGFILYAAIGAGVLGIFLGGHAVVQPAFKTWDTGGFAGSLFPFLFVTIACGACSGFHGLVCSGTTSKQIDRESHCRPVGFGAMLAEAFVALIALATVMIATSDAVRGVAPGKIYGEGIGRFLTLVVGEKNLAVATTFGAMAFSTFVFDTLDVAMRLGRYLVQELTGLRGRSGALVATLLTAIPPALVLAASGPGGWRSFWTLFGASNQLLAALTLIALTVWFRRTGRSAWFTAIPSAFVLVITVWALGAIVLAQGRRSTGFDVPAFNAAAAGALLLLAGYVAFAAARALRTPPERSPGAPPTSRAA
jgi:carbon starvation protein